MREAPTPEPSPEGPTKLAAVVLNPSKFPDAEVPKALIRAECHTHGWPDPLIGINRQVPRPRGSGSAVQNGPITALK